MILQLHYQQPLAVFNRQIREKTKSNYVSLSDDVLMSARERFKRPTTEDVHDVWPVAVIFDF